LDQSDSARDLTNKATDSIARRLFDGAVLLDMSHVKRTVTDIKKESGKFGATAALVHGLIVVVCWKIE